METTNISSRRGYEIDKRLRINIQMPFSITIQEHHDRQIDVIVMPSNQESTTYLTLKNQSFLFKEQKLKKSIYHKRAKDSHEGDQEEG